MSEFRFKKFAVEQEGVAMKVGTDGVLLGAWCPLKGREQRILDIGTGTGVIALMLAQRSEAERIVGVDIDAGAVEVATSNFSRSAWSERLSAVKSPIEDFEAEQFDLIVSNPPYFVDSLHSPDTLRTVARHTASLSFEALSAAVELLLAPEGRFALILPSEEMRRFARITPLRMSEICEVFSTPDATAPKRIMAMFERGGCEGDIRTERLVIQTAVRGEYSPKYRALTRDFYLKF